MAPATRCRRSCGATVASASRTRDIAAASSALKPLFSLFDELGRSLLRLQPPEANGFIHPTQHVGHADDARGARCGLFLLQDVDIGDDLAVDVIALSANPLAGGARAR